MATLNEITRDYTWDKTSQIWIEQFSLITNLVLPVEFVYGDWFWWQGNHKAKRAVAECLASAHPLDMETGSQSEGFCIPRFFISKSDAPNAFLVPLDEREYWEPDRDCMQEVPQETNSIFTIEHLDDPLYVKLRLIGQWKADHPQYGNTKYLHQAFNLPLVGENDPFYKMITSIGWSSSIHGPVSKMDYGGFPCGREEDRTSVFKYPTAWPEPAMEWMVRSREFSWPSADLIQDIVDSGCHLAPVGRGKRKGELLTLFQYNTSPDRAKNPEPSSSNEMDQFEWRVSFSIAENKLGQSLNHVQRHTIILLKILKKVYFPEVVSS
ncbi:uncharacterized protein LOC5503171 [Nematostella vectensis]|uniref:uncharacterized protein LOC5503171 n=1 Tax=Nematostella vectensis TaxID=45351 RepID=UPI00207717E9|nr:uncharacterized protein LOC5503171 [Nematostella vectensis]